ncbi:MAG TPA: hypothetical protein VK775_09085 [Chthoniobacterales bacterium]|jgi:hypothetical protein|nr:hypothetical protein [Chthoniobacterales bacterium]
MNRQNYLKIKRLSRTAENSLGKDSVTLAQDGATQVSHAVTLSLCGSYIRPLIFPDPAIMLGVALAKEWLWSTRISIQT